MPAQWHPICATQRVASLSRWVLWRGPDWQCQSPKDGAKRHVGRQSVAFPQGSLFPWKRKRAGWSLSRGTGNKKRLSVPLLVSKSKCGCGYSQLLKWPWCHAFRPCSNSVLSPLSLSFQQYPGLFPLVLISLICAALSLFHNQFKCPRMASSLYDTDPEQEWLKCKLWLYWIPAEYNGALVGDHS